MGRNHVKAKVATVSTYQEMGAFGAARPEAQATPPDEVQSSGLLASPWARAGRRSSPRLNNMRLGYIYYIERTQTYLLHHIGKDMK
jgi:hypothetical protein